MTNQRNSTRTGQFYNKGSTFGGTILIHSSGLNFCGSSPCFTVNPHRFSQYLDGNFGCLETFLIRAKDSLRIAECNQYFVAPAPYHIPLRGSECHSESTSIERENAFWTCVWDCGREIEVYRWTDEISNSLSKWSPLKGMSCHLEGMNDSFIPLDKSSRRLPFCRGILQFWTTNQ